MADAKKSGKMAAGAAVAVFVMLYAIYMFHADNVYFWLSGKSYIEKIPAAGSWFPRDTLQMGSVLDHAPANNPFDEGKGFRGEFVGSENKKGATQLRVFFRSPAALFELKENRRSFWDGAEKTVVNFYASTAGLERGVYQLGLFLADDKGKRFAWVDSFFEKVKGGPVEYIARPAAPLQAKISKDLKFAIETVDRRYKKIVLEGWTVIENADMNGFNAYLLVKDAAGAVRMFYSPLFARSDLIAKYNDPRAANGGFRIKILQQELPPGEYAVAVVLQSRKTGEAVASAQNQKIRLLPTARGISARIRRQRAPSG
ncbi:MAG TPA: hypothetical protein VF451_01430 [Acidobacteriota bacterium]